jgi:hypothetical protein
MKTALWIELIIFLIQLLNPSITLVSCNSGIQYFIQPITRHLTWIS